MSTITIAVVPRDRFSKTGTTVRRVLEVTPAPFRLVVVDAGMPQRYRTEVERAAAKHQNCELLRSSEYVNSNAAKNWVLKEVTDGEFIAFVENDNEVHPGWLEKLICACDEENADVGRPMIFERKIFRTFPHFDQRLDRIQTTEGPSGKTYRFLPRRKPLSTDVHARRHITQVLETHCLLFRRSVFDKIGLFDERINTRQEVDLALQLHVAGARIVFEPAAAHTYHRPPPVYRDEREYFYLRWDADSASRSHEIIKEKWGAEIPSSVKFVQYRKNYVSYTRYAGYYFRHEFGPYIRYELGPNLRYAAYRTAAHLPDRFRDPIQKALYG